MLLVCGKRENLFYHAVHPLMAGFFHSSIIQAWPFRPHCLAIGKYTIAGVEKQPGAEKNRYDDLMMKKKTSANYHIKLPFFFFFLFGIFDMRMTTLKPKMLMLSSWLMYTPSRWLRMSTSI